MSHRKRILAVTGSLIVATTVAAPMAGAAGGGSYPLVAESFTGSGTSSSNWELPAPAGARVNDACLTGSTSAGQTPVPGCDPQAQSVGSQAGLQLTPNENDQEGGVGYGLSVPTSHGLDVTFDSYQYGGTGADGILFFLAGSDPSDPASSPVTLGPVGGNLAYSPNTTSGVPGLSNGYLGVGLDAYGNYHFGQFSGVGCEDGNSEFSPGNLTVRGPGSGTNGYCILDSRTGVAVDSSPSGPTDVPVEIVVNPTNDAVQAQDGTTVPSGDFYVAATDTNDHVASLLDPLPSDSYLDQSWLDDNGVPKQLTFGWAASTGAQNDYHTISNVNVTTFAATPQLAVTLTDDHNGTAQNGQTVNYTAVTTVSTTDENQPITLTDTFPAGLTPQPPQSVNGWSNCGISNDDAQTVTCTSTGTVTAGTPLSVTMPVTATFQNSSLPRSVDDTATAASSDGNPGNDTDTVTYTPAPTATALAFTNQPVNSQVNAPMLNADGTIRHVQVSAEVTPGGAVDPLYTGQVTLSFANNPTDARFVAGGNPVASLTANAVNGVADFSPVIVNAVGFGYTLQATATGLSPATSNAFDVNSQQTTCTGNNCTVTTTSSGVPGLSATITQTGPGTLTASFGGNVAPIHPCTKQSPSILTFSGTGQKTITMTIPTKIPVLVICYGQPTPFIDALRHPTTFQNPDNGNEFEGALPLCLPRIIPAGNPCISGGRFNGKTHIETVTVRSGAADPHMTGG